MEVNSYHKEQKYTVHPRYLLQDLFPRQGNGSSLITLPLMDTIPLKPLCCGGSKTLLIPPLYMNTLR